MLQTYRLFSYDGAAGFRKQILRESRKVLMFLIHTQKVMLQISSDISLGSPVIRVNSETALFPLHDTRTLFVYNEPSTINAFIGIRITCTCI
jgi:hypothetical protein